MGFVSFIYLKKSEKFIYLFRQIDESIVAK